MYILLHAIWIELEMSQYNRNKLILSDIYLRGIVFS